MKPWASPYFIRKTVTIGRLNIEFKARSNEGYMGRFGGGWAWKLGFQASTPGKWGWTVIVSLLIADIRIYWKTVKAIQQDESCRLFGKLKENS